SGAPVVVRLAVKPTPSIARPQRTIDREGRPAEIVVKGRHDPCIAPRIVPVAEAMCALVVYDLWLTQQELVAGSLPAAGEWDWEAVEALLAGSRD
ncbi:MAG TPA: chorismate synthase, partial [Holophaga sp.]|nr:chorismate synthase [Holophaga sp.]